MIFIVDNYSQPIKILNNFLTDYKNELYYFRPLKILILSPEMALCHFWIKQKRNQEINNETLFIMNAVNEKLQKSCQGAVGAIKKLKNEDLIGIQEKLEWCLGSYEFDKNPSGLHEYGVETLRILKDVKSKQPRKVTKKVIEDLEKAIKNYS